MQLLPRSPTSGRTATIVAAVLLSLAAGCASVDAPAIGRWRAVLDSPGGALPFDLMIARDGSGWSATIRNGEERLGVETVELADGRIRFGMARYDSTIEAVLREDGTRLEGRWTKTAGPDEVSTLPFTATFGDAPRFERPADAAGVRPGRLADLDGRWSVRFDGDEHPAVGLFAVSADGRVEGTFLTTTGDYRYLEGDFDGSRLRLSCFDGAHAFLFTADLGDDDRLEGDFWSRDTWHQRWTAERDPDAALPDGFELTGYRGERSLGELAFDDLDGTSRTLNDPAFAGRARIIKVFGTWCPNCNDSIGHLVELDRRYGPHGLSIVGIAFELTGDATRDARQVERFAEHHGVAFPLLLGGVSDKDRASEAFPLLDRIRSYPTTIFLHGDGRIRAVHQGYVGPAAADEHTALRRRFDELVRELLAEESGT